MDSCIFPVNSEASCRAVSEGMSEAGQGAVKELGFGVQVQGLLGNFWQCSWPDFPSLDEPHPWAGLPTPLLRW